MEKLKTNKNGDVIEEIPFRVKEYKFHTMKKPFKFINHLRKYNRRFFMIMQRENGMIDLGFIYYERNMFVFNKGVYLIHQDFYTWSDTLNSYVGFYKEGFSLPINFEIDGDLLKQAVTEKLKGFKVSANADATILHSLVNTEVIQKVMAGEKIAEFLEKFKMLLIASIGIGMFILGFLFWKFF